MNLLQKEQMKNKFSKKTENGDDSFTSTGNKLADILFMADYFTNNLENVSIGNSDKEKLFSMYMRDPRFGQGRRDLGRELMTQSGITSSEMALAGRFDDLWIRGTDEDLEFLKSEIDKGNMLAKKWMPRYSSKNLNSAKIIAKIWGMNKQQYGKYIKNVDTVEYKLSYAEIQESSKLDELFEEKKYKHPLVDTIDFEKVPSLAMTKYFRIFSCREDLSERFGEYIQKVKENKAKLNTSTATVKEARKTIMNSNDNSDKAAEVIGSKIVEQETKGLDISAICVLDTSASMTWSSAYDDAMAVAHAIATNNNYAPNQLISFSSNPKLMTIKGNTLKEQYDSMHTGDCSDTNLGKVFNLLKNLKKFPDYVIVLSDMEFNEGANSSYKQWLNMVEENNVKTKIIFWNFNNRNRTCPELDEHGNIYLSGSKLTSLMQIPGVIDMDEYIDNLLEDYAKNIKINLN